MADKLDFALKMTMQKLQQVFGSHIVVVPTSHPLQHVLKYPETSERLAYIAIE